ncbi:MAG: hypothetical protein AAB607_01735 [Patescibacteria group bacterium]
MLKKSILLLLLLALLISPMAIISAAEDFGFEITLIKEKYEFVLEIINLALAVVVAILAIQIAALVKGGSMEKTWTLLSIGLFFFAVLEVYGTLKNFKILRIEGLGDVLEFLILIAFLAATFKMKKLLEKSFGE